MPLIADPGYDLGREAAELGHAVTCAPGPSAVLTALTLGGLPTDAFFFAGFLPNSKSARCTKLEKLQSVPGTQIFYESPKRLAACLKDMETVLGADRDAAVCRELTKKFEEVARGTLAKLAAIFAERSVKGEVVILVDRRRSGSVNAGDLEEDLKGALDQMSVKDASELVAQAHGLPKRQVYQLALKLGKAQS